MKKLLYCLLLLSSLALPSCKKNANLDPMTGVDSTSVDEPTQPPTPGFGTSKARPQGTPFVFPAGIRVVGKPINEQECLNEAITHQRMVGEGGLVHFCISFQNTTSAPIKLEFPPKTIWIAENLDMQNGITLKWTRLVIPAQSTVLFHLNAFCINPPRSPTGFSERYEPQPIVSNNPAFDELVQLLATKKVSYEEYGGYDVIRRDLELFESPFVTVQMAVEVLASGRKISPEIRELIARLPTLN